MTKSNATIAQVVAERKAVWSGVRRADLARQIRDLMRAKGLLNKDLAERMGVTEANISRMLKGRQNFQLETLFMIADAMEEVLSIVIGEAKQQVQEKSVATDNCRNSSAKNVSMVHEGFASYCKTVTVETYVGSHEDRAPTYAKFNLNSSNRAGYIPTLMSAA
ncbi:XRE family transcriptional regulator [Herbaspirillum huttiense]|uniref:XRE family transcriptional regulator n=1 Tax=Herbaspirillum huttiense TaxID=863372 RepID=UPI002E773914|nr:XRE family transcriptional regulator [Herbaspirillum huttiense]MEE1634871.1 XRE family transcriptional regulator [Herbaspirillum huttiense NC40101]